MLLRWNPPWAFPRFAIFSFLLNILTFIFILQVCAYHQVTRFIFIFLFEKYFFIVVHVHLSSSALQHAPHLTHPHLPPLNLHPSVLYMCPLNMFLDGCRFYIIVYFNSHILFPSSLTTFYLLLSSYFHFIFPFLSCYNLFSFPTHTTSPPFSLSKPIFLSMINSHYFLHS